MIFFDKRLKQTKEIPETAAWFISEYRVL